MSFFATEKEEDQFSEQFGKQTTETFEELMSIRCKLCGCRYGEHLGLACPTPEEEPWEYIASVNGKYGRQNDTKGGI